MMKRTLLVVFVVCLVGDTSARILGDWKKFNTYPSMQSAGALDNDLWMATGNYDTVYQMHSDGSISTYRPGNGLGTINLLAIDSRNRHVWAGDRSKLLFFDGSMWRQPAWSADFFSGKVLTNIRFSSDGSLWLGTEKNGLFRINISTGEFKNFTVTDGLKDGVAYPIAEVVKNEMWFCSGGNLYISRNDSIIPTSFVGQFPATAPRTIKKLSDGRVLVGSDEGLSVSNGSSWSFYRMPNRYYYSSPEIRDVFEDSAGTIWVATGNYLANFDGTQLIKNEAFGNYGSRIYTFTQTADGRMWAVGGLVLTYRDRQWERYGLPTNSTSCIVGLPDSTVWVGTGIGVFILKNGLWRELLRQGTRIGTGSILSIYRDDQNKMWFGTSKDTVWCLNDTVWKAYTVDKKSSPTTDVPVTAICQDAKGTLWIGTHFSWLQKLTDTGFVPQKVGSGQQAYNINGVVRAKSGDMWVATNDGIKKLGDTLWTNYIDSAGDVGVYVDCVAEGSGNAIWAGSTAGLHKYHEGTWRLYVSKDGLPGEHVNSIDFDFLDRMWVATERGVSVFASEIFTPVELFYGGYRVTTDYLNNLWIFNSYTTRCASLTDTAEAGIRYRKQNKYISTNAGMRVSRGAGTVEIFFGPKTPENVLISIVDLSGRELAGFSSRRYGRSTLRLAVPRYRGIAIIKVTCDDVRSINKLPW